ncbi:hypothetical protein QBC40DRAFT_323518 [Triangularia verruculosa]|uniref:F-box domain-containing protein n=1 Tax=Triangularia verruculosa TaxID=2587418 RepID=A0AAN6XJL9_9PEZI|nr:hypothetical protein QBC40DRAFT_323518 [Triangularia verruculosa]
MPTLGSLPRELTAHIVSFLAAPSDPRAPQDIPKLAPYSTISRDIQDLIEAQTFSEVTVYSIYDQMYRTGQQGQQKTGLSLPEFVRLFGGKNIYRRGFLKTLRLVVVLPRVDQRRLLRFQNHEEARLDNKAYTKAILWLFHKLSLWESEPKFELLLETLQLSQKRSGYLWTRSDFKMLGVDETVFMKRTRGEGWLQTVGVVKKLQFGENSLFCGGWPVMDPGEWGLGILLDGIDDEVLEDLSLTFHSPPRRSFARRRAHREGITQTLQHQITSLTALTKLRIWWSDRDPMNHNFRPGNFVENGEKDRFSLALRKLSHLPALRELVLEGNLCLGTEFWDEPSGQKKNTWPSLKTLKIDMSMITPDGRWHYGGDPESENPFDEPEDDDPSDWEDSDSDGPDDDWDTEDTRADHDWNKADGVLPNHKFRHEPDDETFGPFMAAMIRATARTRMPALESMEFKIAGGTDESVMEAIYADTTHTMRSPWVIYDEEVAKFHNGAAPFNKPRWALYLERLVGYWKILSEITDAFTETVGKGCVLIWRDEWINERNGLSETEVM